MHHHRFTFACLATCFLIYATASAAEKTVTAKVKAVDAAKNSITLDDIELDVTRKTKITVDGKKASLADIKTGQQATVIYDDGLEVAASISVGKEAEKDEEATAKAMKSLQGDWKCIADRALDKKKIKEEDRRVTIKGNSFTMKRTSGDKRGTYDGKFEIDASNGYFDFVGKGPNGEYSEWVGLYELDEDTVSFSYKLSTKDEKAVRPKTLKDGFLQVFKRDND